jgi:hypothetical protein
MGLRTHLTNIYLHVFRKEQLAALYAQRAGQCNACGQCCDPVHLPFSIRIRCPLLNPKTRKCRVYGSAWRPLVCQLSPTFQTKEEEDRHQTLNCGFYRARDEIL